MRTRHFLPLYPLIEPVLLARQPPGFRGPHQGTNGWLTGWHSPLREDTHPSFAIKPDSETDPGAYQDFGTGERGSMAELARRLGLDPRISTPAHGLDPRISTPGRPVRPPAVPHATPSSGSACTLRRFCAERALNHERLVQVFGVSDTQFGRRPALRYPTPLGVDRIKFIDGLKPKYSWATSGGQRHWYGLDQARRLSGETLYIVNGEPSVWAAQQAGVPAVCVCGGEAAQMTDALIAQLKTVVVHGEEME